MLVYNSEAYVFEAIKSILNQTFTDFELLVINDGSTDNSEKIILSFKDTRIRYFKNGHNAGIIYSRNFGLQKASGEYIAMIDSDDISFPVRLERQFKFMSENPFVGVCGAVAEFIGTKKGIFGHTGNSISTFTKLMITPPFGQSTAFIRKSVLDAWCLQYNPDYAHAEDYKLWLDISKHADIYCLPETLVYYRWHLTNDSSLHQQKQQESAGKIQKEWFELVLNRNLTKCESIIFECNPSSKTCLAYNILCLTVLKSASVPIDKKSVMEQRIRMNRSFLNSSSTCKILKISMPFRILDRLISRVMILYFK